MVLNSARFELATGSNSALPTENLGIHVLLGIYTESLQ